MPTLLRYTSALALILLLGACAAPQPSDPGQPGELGGSALFEGGGWVETDAVITLRNEVLEAHFRDALLSATAGQDFALENVELDFSGESIGLRAPATLTEDGAVQNALLEGDIRLSFSGTGLSWFPRIQRVLPRGDDANAVGADANADTWRDRINAHWLNAIVIARNNRLGFRLGPPDSITVDASLPGLASTESGKGFDLEGAFTVAASAVQANQEQTAIALDMEFVDGISNCDADYAVSRSSFAGRIVNREPSDIKFQLPADAPEWHYFTEVSGARRNLTLLHYWFADGRPIGVTELTVAPSARWRTWSSVPIMPGTAQHLEVFAVDRDSGCILDAAHIELAPGRPADSVQRPTFEAITRAFPAAATTPGVGMAEVAPGLVAEALEASLGDARLALRFQAPHAADRPLSAHLASLAGANFDCQWRDCTVRTECRADFSRCERKQDTRDCSTCLFRNPLNNRCVSQRIDAECEDSKARANARFEAAWEDCMAREQSAQAACERQGQEAVESCISKGETYLAACEANREILNARFEPLAEVSGQARVEGELTLRYAEIDVGAGLARLKGLLVIEPDLTLQGRLRFEPRSVPGDFGDCLSGWDAAFETRLDRPQPPRRLTGAIAGSGSALLISWPGLTVPLNMNDTPLETMLASQPELYSPCNLGLTPSELSARLSGEDGHFLRGVLPVNLRPGTARIEWPDLTAEIGGLSYSAVPVFDQGPTGLELMRLDLMIGVEVSLR